MKITWARVKLLLRQSAQQQYPTLPIDAATMAINVKPTKTVRKISTGKKLAYVAGFGILAAPAFKKVRSQFECKSCGYKW